MNSTFVDTYFYLALLAPTDAAHRAAIVASQSRSGLLVTTHWILMEVADALAAPRFRHKFTNLLASLDSDPTVTIVPAEDRLFRRGVALYRQYSDKDWPLTDCISFVIMRDLGIHDALTGDVHFRQAGFNALL